MNKDLTEKYQNDYYFKQQINTKKQQAQRLSKRTKEKDLAIVPQTILCKYPSLQNQIYFYFGYQQPVPKRLLINVVMFLLKNFDPSPNKPFTLVFFNQFCQDNYILWNFRQTLAYLSLQTLGNLKQFIIVKPFFYHRTMDFMTFGSIAKYIKSKQRFLYSNTELCEHLKITPQDLVQYIPVNLYEKQFPDLVGTDLSVTKLRYNISGQHRLISSQEQEFQKSIKSMIMKPGSQINCLQDYEISQIGVPLILKMLIYYFETYPEGIKLQGIFRKSVSIDEQNQIIKKIMENNYDYLLEVKNPHVIANLIKKFFASLKVPIIPFVQFQLLMDDKKVTNKLQHLCKVLQNLPQLNILSLMFLINFLCDSIIINQSQNKMNAQNLAICFAPCLLHSKIPTQADLIYAGKAVVYTKFLITERQKVFGTPQEQQARYRQSYIRSRQDLQKAINLVYETNDMIQNLIKEEKIVQNKLKNNRFSRKMEQNYQQFDINNYVDDQQQKENQGQKKQEKREQMQELQKMLQKIQKPVKQDVNMEQNQNSIQQKVKREKLEQNKEVKQQNYFVLQKNNKNLVQKEETNQQTISKQIQCNQQ